jgi:tetratricopeptide (TPR) repeat protein
MRFAILALGFAFSLGLSACGKKESRSEEVSTPKPKVEEALPADGEERYRATYVKAAQAFSRNDLDGALAALELSDQAKPNQASNANLRGAIFTRKRDWAKAEEAFRLALKLQPDLPMAQFNLGEVLFLNNKYPEAREKFQIFINSQPSNDLGLYKIYLCDLLGGNTSKANSFLDSLKPSPNSPIYYFSKAAEAFHRNDKVVATEFVTSAYRIYPPDANSTFADSLVEKGYLTGEQVTAPQAEDTKPKTDELKTLLPSVEKAEKKPKS